MFQHYFASILFSFRSIVKITNEETGMGIIPKSEMEW